MEEVDDEASAEEEEEGEVVEEDQRDCLKRVIYAF